MSPVMGPGPQHAMWDIGQWKNDDSDKTAIGQRVCADIYNNNIDLLKCL
jgi:hypothetical protein